MKEWICKGCNKEIFLIKNYYERRSIRVNREELWIKKDPKGEFYIRENGMGVIGFPVGDGYDVDTDLVKAYEPHMPQCPNNGRAPRNRWSC